MPHPFGELLTQLRTRKHGLSQAKLAGLAGYDAAVLTRMAQGKKDLTGPSGRERVVRLIGVLREEHTLSTLEEANTLLAAARMPPLFGGSPGEAALLRTLRLNSGTAEGAAVEAAVGPTSATNLPAQLTHFVGRAHEVVQVQQLVRAHRLVTLTGAGGVGKTRLALEVGATFLEPDNHRLQPAAFPDGVWLAELAPLADPALLAQVVARALHLPEQPWRAPIDALIAGLTGKRLLLIWDNCEHLIQACAELAETLLTTSSELHMLTTSREVLNISGEVIWRVLPLSVPDPANLPPLERMLSYEAVELFVNHASAAQPDFRLDVGNVSAVARICRRLDGIPLAIEMAAAQVSAYSAGEVATALDDHLALRMTGRRTALPRHRTMHAALDWSYQLLSAPERRLLGRLSVFAGGCTAEAALAVCADSDTPPEHTQQFIDSGGIPAVLARLVHKSLVVADTRGEQTCYHLQEVVRQYAYERLAECGGVKPVRERHLAYYLAMAEQTTDLSGRHVDAWRRRIGPEYDNLRVAFAWARTRDDQGEMALRLAAALRPFWYKWGHITEGLAWLGETLARGVAAPAVVRARALLAQASLYLYKGDMSRALSAAQSSLLLFRGTEDRVGTAWCLELLTNHLNSARAQELAEESLALFKESGSLSGVGRALSSLAATACRAGDPMRAATLFEQAIAAAREIDDVRVISHCLSRLYTAAPQRAVQLGTQELARLREAGDEEHIATLCAAYGELLVAEGEYERARPVLEEGVAWWQRSDTPSFWAYNVRIALGYAELCLGHVDQAVPWFVRAQKGARELGTLDLMGDLAQFLLSSAAAAQGDLASAGSYARECLQQYHQYGFRSETVFSFEQLADLARRQGDMQRAAKLLGAAKGLGGDLDSTSWMLNRIFWRWHQDTARSIIEPTIAVARPQLGDDEFASAYAQGEHMTLEQAVEYALATVDPVSAVAQDLKSAQPAPPRPTPAGAHSLELTVREVEVLRLVAAGMTDVQVAEKLIISRRTVNTHLSSIYSKLGVNSRTAAVRVALDQHLL